ncbi:MAG: shikimate dehydrogenase [Symbiobacteriia bacterium]
MTGNNIPPLSGPPPSGPYGLIGHPVGHSLSPVMHDAAFRSRGLPFRYWLYDVPPAELGESCQRLRDSGIQGFNVTIPHKQAILPYLDDLSAEARLIGAVNTVCSRDGTWVGHNTDAPGLLDALLGDAGFDPAGCSVTLLGAGGAARAAAFALAQAGVRRLSVFSRRLDRAQHLTKSVSEHASSCEAAAFPWDRERIALEMRGTDLLVNATPVGMSPADQDSPIADPDWLRQGMVVFDLVYRPRQTKLLRDAAALGARTLDGLSLLLYQGARAFELWLVEPAPLEVMRSALVANRT